MNLRACFLIGNITIANIFFEIVNSQVVFLKIWTLTNQNQKVSYPKEDLELLQHPMERFVIIVNGNIQDGALIVNS